MANINIGATSYSIEDDWLNVAMKYFRIDPENENAINMLKAGLFGYNNEIQSNEIKNNVYHRNVLYDEHFLNTASFPESIANFAKINNVDTELATPSKIRATLAISKSDIIESPLKEEIASKDTTLEGFSRRVYLLTISKNFIFSIEQIPFRLPYDLQFIIKENEVTGTYSITVKYNTEESTFPFIRSISNPYLKTWNETTDKGDYLFVGIDLYQLYRTITTFSITSNTVMDNIFLSTTFANQVAYVEVYYVYNGVRTKINTYQNTNQIGVSGQEYCYYTILGNTIELTFGSDSNAFRPRKNSEIELVLYTTYGSRGNFTYNGNINVNFGNSNDFSKLAINVTPITDASGGKDKLTTTELKNKIIEEIISRKNIITDIDLNYYFNNFNSNTSVNGSNIEFFKKRNDILKRLFTGYLTMRERGGKVIPTNTAPHLLINKDHLNNPFGEEIPNEESRGMIRDNSKVLYDRMNDKFILFENNFVSIDKSKVFIVDKTPEGLNFEYDIIAKRFTYMKFEKDEKDEYTGRKLAVQYEIDSSSMNMRKRTVVIDNDSGLEEDVITDWRLVAGGFERIICAEKSYALFINSGNLVLSMDVEDFELEENMVITEANEYGFKINSDEYLSDYRFILYAIPYVLKVIDKPVLKCNYYITSVYNMYEVQLAYTNNFINKNFIFSNIQIEKDPNVGLENNAFSVYELTANLNTNLTIDELDNSCIVRAIIYNKDGELQGYINLEHDVDSFVYRGKIATYRDIINKNECIKVAGSLLDINNGNPINVTYLTDKINIELTVLYKDGVETAKYNNFDYMQDVTEYATTSVYTNTDPIVLYRNLESYIHSDVLPVKIMNSDGTVASEYYDIKQVPLVEYSYYQQKYDEVLDILDVYDDVSLDLINSLENNNSLDLKFTNTYGASKFWVTDTNNKEFEVENFDYLDITSIPLNFTIYTNGTVNSTTDNNIKEFISEFVESSNSTGLFAMSNLIRELENSFEVIQYVEFGQIANENTQKIFNTFSGFNNMTTEEINDYIPEYLNIQKILKYDNSTDNDVDLYLKYDYDINITYK